jgi:hypothetical protein
MTKYFDLNTVPGNGLLIFPLSMSRLQQSLSAGKIYEFLEFFEAKLTSKTCDVVFLYTNDLYQNSEESAFSVRKRVLNQMIDHHAAFTALVANDKRFFPGSFHFLPWDYVCINTLNLNNERARLFKHMREDPLFLAALRQDLQIAEKDENEINLHFLIEELVISHLIMEKEVAFPHRLSTEDGWSLMCYPGNPPVSLAYIWHKNLLGNRNDLPKKHHLFARSFYNMEERVLIDFKLARCEPSPSHDSQIVYF